MKFLFLFLLSSPTWAWDVGPLLSNFNQGMESDALTCDESENNKNTAQACAQEICGIPGSFPSDFVTGNELQDFKPTPEIQTEIERSLEEVQKVADEWEARVYVSLTDFHQYLKKSAMDFSPAAIPDVWQLLNKHVGYRVEDGKIKMILDFPEGADEDYKKGIEDWAKNREVIIQNDPVVRVRLGLTTPKEALLTLKKRFAEIQAKVETLPEAFPNKKGIKGSYANANPLFENPAPNEGQVNQAASYLDSIEIGSATTDIFLNATQNVYDPACKKPCLDGLKPLMTGNSFMNRVDVIKVRLERDKENFIQNCKTGIMLQAKYGQLPGQRAKALKILASSLDKVTATSWWSSHTKVAFKDFIQTEVKVAESFASKEILTKENMSMLMDYQGSKLVPQSLFRTVLKLEGQKGNLYANNLSICPSPKHIATDSFQYQIQKPLLHVSPFSCEHEGQGQGIIAHELGHGLSAFMLMHSGKSPESALKYKSLRDCVKTSNPLNTFLVPDNAILPFAGDGLTTEEDMADWLSFGSVPQERPIACTFIKTSASNSKVFDDEAMSLKPYAGDTHSSSLLRAIRQVHQQTGSLPASCRSLLNDYKGVVEVKKCE